MITQEEIEEIGAKIELTIDNPKSVKKQLRQLNLIKQELMIKKRELQQELKELNSNDNQQLINNVLMAGTSFLPKEARKWQGVIRGGVREVMRNTGNNSRKPHVEVQDLIEDFILQIDTLRLQAQEYLSESEETDSNN